MQFSTLAHLAADAWLEITSAYDKLANLPVRANETLLAEGTRWMNWVPRPLIHC